MPRVKLPGNYQARSEGASSSRAPPPKRSRVNPEERRRNMINKKRILRERGLDLMALRQTFVVGAIDALGWQQVAAQQLPYNEGIVREFYTMCARETFLESGRVLIQGREVIITPARINNFYGLPSMPEFIDGLPPLPEVEMNEVLASALRVNGNPLWGRDGKIKQAELHFNAAFWNMFSSHSIQPTRHTSDIAIKRSRVVYCLMNHRPFDLGVVIFNEIAERSVGEKGVLPFPGLITFFCASAGFQLDPRHFRPADTLIGHLSYNAVIHKRRGIRKITRSGDLQPLEPEPIIEEDRVADDTDAADEFSPDHLFDIDRDMPARGPFERVAPSQSEAGPSQWQEHPAPPPAPPAPQSLSTELLQQILDSVGRIEMNQREFQTTTVEKLAELEQRIELQQTTFEQHLAEHRVEIHTSITQLQAQQQQQHAQQQEHLSALQSRTRQIETMADQIWAGGITMSDRIGAFEFAVEDYRNYGSQTRNYRTRVQRTREAARQRQAAAEAAQAAEPPPFHPGVNQYAAPPPEDIPDYHPMD